MSERLGWLADPTLHVLGILMALAVVAAVTG